MKQIKLLISVLLIVTIALVSCKKDGSTGPGAGGDLLGIWNIIGGNFGWVITTNTNQVATNTFDVTGEVSISGTHTATLDFMVVDNEAVPPSIVIFDLNAPDDQNIMLMIDGSTGEGMLLANGQTFLGTVTYTYTNGALTITQSTLTDVASDATVTISGSMSIATVNIPANTPTAMQFTNFDDGDNIGLTTVEFKNDGTAVVTDLYDGATETESWTYSTSGGQLTVTDEFGDTMTWEYSVTGNNMTWNAIDSEDWCDATQTQAECYGEFEEVFGLDAGSVTNIGSSFELMFSKAAAKHGLNIGKTFNLMNPIKEISDNMQKVENLKKSM